jgi:hypothetical protein
VHVKYFVCSNEGFKSAHSTHETKKERASTRPSCEDRVQFYVSKEDIWIVQKVVLNHDNSWIQNIYKIHNNWATIHRRDSFYARITSTQRSEGMNNAFMKTF